MIYNSRDYARLRNGVLFISAVAWGLLLSQPQAACHCNALSSGLSWETLRAAFSPSSLAMGWVLMLVAMMAPTLVPAIYHVRTSTFRHRRGRSTALFLAGFGAIWMVAGADLLVAELAVAALAPGSYWPAIVTGLAALVWQMSPDKQRCLNRCHNHRPLAAFGVAADWDVFRLGFAHGFWCVGSCWAAMLLPMMLPTGHLAAMAAVSVLMFCERLDPPRPPAWRWRGFDTAVRYGRLWLRSLQPEIRN